MRSWDQIDQHAEMLGKHIGSRRPFSDRVAMTPTKHLDTLWNKLVKEVVAEREQEKIIKAFTL